jgi:hypothetical protein
MPPPLPFANPAEDPRSIRKTHLSHEASVRSVGVLFVIGAVILVGLSMVRFLNPQRGPLVIEIAVSLIIVVLGVLQFWTGIGLRRLKPWARVPTGLFAGVGLLGFPIGTLINVYVLYLVFSTKGKTVFSEQYQAVIAATPDMKYRTSIIVWAFLGILIAVLLLIVIVVATSPRHR